ncbi:hypothetical protein [Streptomyces sp. NPDC093261]|uniref:hypothetical protein n=1 Tax=Streptomyces sp. NPDC093261 TaxID=3366037 RepID=UPI0038260EF5
MTEIIIRGPDRTCDLRQIMPARMRASDLGAVAQYHSRIAELSGFGRACCASDAD